MSKVKLYIARHGKTMFNTIGRAQGWSDSPLTPFGEEGIRELGVGLKAAGIPFKAAYSSDSGRTIQTMDIILRETGLETIPSSILHWTTVRLLLLLMKMVNLQKNSSRICNTKQMLSIQTLSSMYQSSEVFQKKP